MAARTITTTSQTTDDTRPTNGGSGSSVQTLVFFDDAGVPANILAAFDRGVELIVRDYQEQAIG